MTRLRPIHALLICALLGLVAAKPKEAPTAQGAVSFSEQVKLGNVFATGEKVEIAALVAAGDHVDWTVTDYHGTKVGSGTTPVADQHVKIAPGISANGFYLLHISPKAIESQPQEAITSFAIVPPVDVAAMADTKFGVMTHFAQNMSTDMLPLIAEAGIANTRDEQYWGQLEKTPGQFDFNAGDGKFTNYMAADQKLHITPLLCMSFENKLYDGGMTPHTPEGNAAYANYCVAVLDHYGKQVPAVEIWNEYNGSFCKGPAKDDRPKFYTAMLKAAYTKIKETHPDVTVIGGAMVNVPLPYCEKLFKEGALNYMDGIDVHPYRGEPEGVEKDLAALTELIKKYNNGKSKPIWCTEIGTHSDESPERVEHASYLLRMYTLLNTQPEVARSYWYLSRDYLNFKNMGIMHGDQDPMGKYTPTAVYSAFATMIQQTAHAMFKQREATDPRTRVYEYTRDGKSIWICWSTVDQTEIHLKTNSPVRQTDLVGGEKQLAPSGGDVAVAVKEEPFYLVADSSAVTSVIETPRPEKILTDSQDDYSSEQGKNNWSYGYFRSNKDGSAPYNPDQFEPMNYSPSRGDWGDVWQGPAAYLNMSGSNAEPSTDKDVQMWAVRRWTSDTAGKVHVQMKINYPSKQGDGVTLNIYQDGEQIEFKQIGPGSTLNLNLEPTLKKGSRLDFALTPGPGLNSSFDATGFRATILTPNR